VGHAAQPGLCIPFTFAALPFCDAIELPGGTAGPAPPKFRRSETCSSFFRTTVVPLPATRHQQSRCNYSAYPVALLAPVRRPTTESNARVRADHCASPACRQRETRLEDFRCKEIEILNLRRDLAAEIKATGLRFTRAAIRQF